MIQRHLLVLALVLGGFAEIASADSKADSQQHFVLASAAHKEGRFRDAVRELMTAYAFDPRPELLYAIGQVHVKLGECPQAITFYQRFLESKPKPEQALRAQKAIQICETNPPPAEPEQADPARPREELGPTKEEHLRKAAEAEAVVAIENRKTEEARLDAERERERERLYDLHPARKWAYTGVAIGVASLAVGGYFGMSSRGAQTAFTDAGCGERDQVLSPDQVAACRDDAERGERDALRGNVLMAVGAGVLVTSLLVFVLDPGNLERTQPAPRISLTAGSIHFTASF